MLKEITLPEIAENVESGIVVEILVSEGDKIEAEQAIVELETDKATFEVPSTEGGIIKEIKVSKGDEVKVGEIIVTLETNGEDEQSADGDKEKEEKPEKSEEEGKEEKKEKEGDSEKDGDSEKEEEPVGEAEPEKQKKEPAKEDEAEEKPVHTDEVPAAPSVRRLARELGIDIHRVKGSGPGGRITKEDVEKQGKQKEGGPREEPVGQAATEQLPDFSKWGSVEKKPLSNIRKITAETMLKSWQTIPHVTQYDEADITIVESFMEKYASKAEKEGGKLTITSILLKLCATALHNFPKFNASIDMQNRELIYKKYFHIGIAVDTPQGLLVPVIRDVDQKSVFKLSAEVSDIANKAREKKIGPEEMQGGNFTISNLGGIGGTNFTPIVYPPQVAILGVSRARKQPFFQDGSSKVIQQNILPLSLSYDHRAIDGAEGARFLRWICNALEDPFMALMEGGD